MSKAKVEPWTQERERVLRRTLASQEPDSDTDKAHWALEAAPSMLAELKRLRRALRRIADATDGPVHAVAADAVDGRRP